jgi:hypothetical protein
MTNTGYRITRPYRLVLAATGTLLLASSGAALAHDHPGQGNKTYTLQGNCAYLPADRATEFHGNATTADLLLGMAGNQWVVFDKVMQGFNVATGRGDGSEPAHRDNPGWTLADLNLDANQYYIQLIPPGQIRNQIKSGCMLLGNDEERNFLPGNIQVDFDVFTSTNYNLMRDLATNGFVVEAAPYIKNKLDLMVDATNSRGVGTAGAPGTYENIFDIVMDLLDDCDQDSAGCTADTGDDPGIVVSQVDHINEGIHNAINKMYKAMDEYIREHGPQQDIDTLDAALAAVSTPRPGSPADTRPGITTDFDLSSNTECHYTGHPTIADGTLRFCEYAVLNKANTHETRVHHVETPGGILGKEGFVSVDVGPVWTSELKYAQDAGDAVSGMDQAGGSGGVSSPADADPVVNEPAEYSIALLATSRNRGLARKFIDYVRSPDGQSKYTDGGFIGLTPEELAGGECYDLDKDGGLIVTTRVGSCPQKHGHW